MKTSILAVLVATSLLAPSICPQASAGERLVLATGQQQAPAFSAGVAIASLIKVDLGPRHKIDLQAASSTGPVDNIRMMQEGAADLAILPSVTGHAARAAIGSFLGDAPERRLRAITTLWRDALHLVVRNDDASTGTIDDFLGLKGRKVFLGDKATGTVDANRLLLSGLGLEIDKTFDVLPSAGGDAIAAMKRGSVDAFSIASRPPSPMFLGMDDTKSAGLTFLEITAEQMTKANGRHWLWTPYTIPATTYPGQDADIETIAHSSLLVVSADLTDETVYLITKSIFDNLPYLHRVDPLLTGLALDQALLGMSLPLHPGALRYFKEAGLIPDTVKPTKPTDKTLPILRDDTGYPNADVAGNRLALPPLQLLDLQPWPTPDNRRRSSGDHVQKARKT